jgi:leucyl aminopeptidase (aminopeptidase T)
MNTQPGQDVLIVTDTEIEPIVMQALATAADELGRHPTICIMTPREYHQQDPTRPIAEAMKHSDLNLLVTSKALIHSPAAFEVMKMRKKCVAMEQVTSDMLTRGASTADYEKMQEVGKTIREKWTKGKHVKVTCDLGTDLTANITDRPGFYVAGIVNEQPGIEMYSCAFPDGEAGISPVEGTGEGTVVFNGTIHNVGLIREPIRLTIKKGWIDKIEGGTEADIIRKVLKEIGDENSYNCPAEISIGINPKARHTGSMREDKKIYGSVHIAMGSSIDTAGTIESKLHIDGVVLRPTVNIDGEIVVENGKLNL